ncbi:MAG: acetylxylan esterase, partial [Pirellulales bacterium]|nr:acetylxylan esterase [Pirellulales bacterium]
MLTRKILLAALVLWSRLSFHLAAAAERTITSPSELWQGFDAEREPLEQQIATQFDDGAGHFETLFFTGEVVDGKAVRVYAIRGTPAADGPQARERIPGILHIHGGGQTASLEWVKFWVRRGYACVSFDFCGHWENRDNFTDWGTLDHCNMATAEGGLQVSPTPRRSSWYHWALVARRALTLLANDPRVDRERIGIFGVSVGGTLCWIVAGSDPRVRAVAPIYGCGYSHDGSKRAWGFDELTPELELWQQAVSAEAHAPYIRCPVMLLNAT